MFLVVALYGGQPVGEKNGKSHEQDIAYQSEQSQTKTTVTIQGNPQDANSEAKSNDPKQESDNRVYNVNVVSQPHDPLYAVYVCLTALTLFVGFATFIMVYKQTKAFRQSERAWMIVNPIFEKLASPPVGQNQNLLYPVSIKNCGKTPATIVEAGVAFRKIDSLSHIPKVPLFEKTEITSLNALLLVPQDSFLLTAPEVTWTREEYGAVHRHPAELFLYAYGFVKYLDAFGKPHESWFCHHYYVSEPQDPDIRGFQRYVKAPAIYSKAT